MLRNSPAKSALIYAVVGAGWILLSDRVLRFIVTDEGYFAWTSTFKEWIFEAVTSLILYRLISRSHTEIKTLISASPLAIVTLDSATNVWIWNSAAERLFGWKADEVRGKLLPIIPETDRESSRCMIEKEMAGEQPDTVELQRLRKEGTLVDVMLWMVSMKDARGAVFGVICMYTDITEKKASDREIIAYQEQLRSMASQLLLTEERGRRMIATALHDQIGQTLAIANLKLGALGKAYHQGDERDQRHDQVDPERDGACRERHEIRRKPGRSRHGRSSKVRSCPAGYSGADQRRGPPGQPDCNGSRRADRYHQRDIQQYAADHRGH